MSGATACTLNCLRTSSTAPNTPPAKKNNCAGRRMRVRRTHSAAFCASKPLNHQWMYQGAIISASTMAVPSTRYMVVRMTESERSPFGFAARIAIAGEDGDKGDGCRAAHQKVRDHVGQHECGIERVGLMPRPKSQTMYLTRTSPMMRDRKVDAISTTVAENAVCACEGRSTPSTRVHRDCGGGKG